MYDYEKSLQFAKDRAKSHGVLTCVYWLQHIKLTNQGEFTEIYGEGKCRILAVVTPQGLVTHCPPFGEMPSIENPEPAPSEVFLEVSQ